MKVLERTFKRTILALGITLLSCLPTHAQIDSNIPDNTPENIYGTWEAPINWMELGLDIMMDDECVDLQWEGFCGGGLFSPVSVRFSYRLPVQVIENVRNVGETLLETPIENALNYFIDYPLFYMAVEQFIGFRHGINNGLISIAANQQRRSGLRVGTDQRLDFAQSHIYAVPTEFLPLVLAWMPSHCTTWIETPDFKNDTFPFILQSRIPELTEAAMPGASLVTPSDCAANNIGRGRTIPTPINVVGNVGPGVGLAERTCASSWGGKVFPLSAHTYSPNPYVGDALRSIKAIEMARFNGVQVYPFNRSRDRLKDFYNGSSCIRFGEQNQSRFPKEQEGKEQITHYVHYLRRSCCL